MQPIWIGIDGGGTKVKAVAATERGEIIAEAISGPCNIAAVGASASFHSVNVAISQLLNSGSFQLSDINSIAIGVAGYSHVSSRVQFHQLLRNTFPSINISLFPDFVLAYHGAFAHNPGVVVIAGTGSLAYGVAADGTSARKGGYGHLLDDGGSGYGIGRQAILAVLSHAHGSGPPTLLTEAVLSCIGSNSVDDIVPAVYGGSLDRLHIAALASGVMSLAESENDSVSIGIIQSAASTLAAHAADVFTRLHQSDRCKIACVGGMWQPNRLLLCSFEEELINLVGSCEVFVSHDSPEMGAVRLARQGAPIV